MSGRKFTPAEVETIRRWHGRITTNEIALRLGRPRKSIYVKLRHLGLTKHYRKKAKMEALENFIRETNRAGWSDEEIARAQDCSREWISEVRRRMGIPNNLYGPRWRARNKAQRARQLAQYGVKDAAHFRIEAWRRRARAQGWPDYLRLREIQILNLLWERGPQTREQLGDALGLRKKPRSDRGRPWYPFLSNRRAPRSTYLSGLVDRGLVINLGRIVSGRGQGANVCMYSLSPTIRRRAGAWMEKDDGAKTA